MPLQPDFLPTAIGSLPHTNPTAACELVRQHLPELPAWPQLPQRTYREAMCAQYSHGFPGLCLSPERVSVNHRHNLEAELEQLYIRYLENDLAASALPAEYAAGLAHFKHLKLGGARAVKGQIIGPVSWGLMLTDEARRSVLYDEVLADAVAKHLRLQAAWQERELRQLAPQTIMFVDEPYLAAFGSAYMAIERDQVLALLEEVFAGLQGLKGLHCCGNTDWSLLLNTSIDILSFDAFNFAENLALYPAALQAFLRRGGILAWGIVPVANAAQVRAATVESLVSRLEAALHLLAAKGIGLDALLNASLITPACGLGTLSESEAARALSLAARVSQVMRCKYLGL